VGLGQVANLDEVVLYIGIPTAEQTRYAMFYDYVHNLTKPKKTFGASFHTNSAARNRNLIIDDALAAHATHILFIDDDMAFAPNSLEKLLAHDKDIVGGLYLSRSSPHLPVIFTFSGGRFVRRFLQDGESGLVEVDATGFGFMLIRTNVFADMKPPYVRHGEVTLDKRNEDLGFCKRAKGAGFKVYCDLDTPIGHMGLATFWPNNVDEKWYTAIDSGGDSVASVRQSTSPIKTPLTV
jgi:hypothetical protein